MTLLLLLLLLLPLISSQESPRGPSSQLGTEQRGEKIDEEFRPVAPDKILDFDIGVEDKGTKTAFIFGGNGQIGAEVVKMLLKEGYDVTMLNRGKDYFNSKQEIEPRVSHIRCDRFKGLEKQCPLFGRYLIENEKVDLVIDTNAYTTKYMRESTIHFKDIIVGLYLFISPDSIYEVCIKRHHGPTLETDAERPTDKTQYDQYADSDKYGHYKLLAEEELRESGLNYLILRAPDVIGPRDTSSRFWIYHMWVKYFNILKAPISLPVELKTLVSSYVYLPDIVQAIELALKRGVKNEVFNLAFQESVTLSSLLLEISDVLNVPITFDHVVEAHNSYHLYPSTGRGQLDIAKARQILGFVPTPFKQAIAETVAYYQRAQKLYPVERLKVVEELVKNVAKNSGVKTSFKNAVLAEAFSGQLRPTKHVEL